MKLNHTGYVYLIQINPQPSHICSQFKSALLEGPDASSKQQNTPGCVALNMLPVQRTRRHPVHRKELCVHPPAPALLSAAPFHTLVLQSFSLVTSIQKQVSPVVPSASAGPVIWEMGSLCLTGSSPKATTPRPQGHTSMGWLRASSGDRCGTHRMLLRAATALCISGLSSEIFSFTYKH